MSRDYNSIKNQSIKGKFVEREIYACVSGMVEYIIKKGFEDREAPFTYEDIENLYADNSDKIEELKAQIEELENELLENENMDNSLIADRKKQISNLESEIEDLEREQEEPKEVYEWWMCSSWLIGKLAEKGYPVLKNENIWGRCTTGQAILLDYSIGQICEELEILEGQANEWKV
jgi:DNA repair exonuclease SbcCD ATPase subunit